MIARGKEQFPYLNLNVNEGKKIPYADNSFDSIILFAVLACIIDDEEQVFLIKEIKSIIALCYNFFELIMYIK